jgi:methylmalonyl-CoA/ethylmalonyl-CoA epimerase
MIFHHDGVACNNIDQEKIFYEQLGFKQYEEVFEDPIQKVRGVFVKNGTMLLELLEPLNNDSPLASFIKRNTKIYQQAFLVRSLEKTIEEFSNKKGWVCLGDPQPAVAFNGSYIVFYYVNDLIVEFIESPHLINHT